SQRPRLLSSAKSAASAAEYSEVTEILRAASHTSPRRSRTTRGRLRRYSLAQGTAATSCPQRHPGVPASQFASGPLHSRASNVGERNSRLVGSLACRHSLRGYPSALARVLLRTRARGFQ